jgi:hypothetical protein
VGLVPVQQQPPAYMTKESGFADWWAQNRKDFDGISESRARAIYDAGQQVFAQGVRDVCEYLRESQERIEKIAGRSKWRVGSNTSEAEARLVYLGGQVVCRCSSSPMAHRVVRALAKWDMKTGVKLGECPMCGSKIEREDFKQ